MRGLTHKNKALRKKRETPEKKNIRFFLQP
jgi:hypothetical protein